MTEIDDKTNDKENWHPRTSELVMVELEQTIEKRWLEEFRREKEKLDALYKLRGKIDRAHTEIVNDLEGVLYDKGVIVPRFVKADGINEEKFKELTEMLMKYVAMGKDFEVIVNAIQKNYVLMDEWEKFMFMLKMAEEDE